jgi:hypothetical protein
MADVDANVIAVVKLFICGFSSSADCDFVAVAVADLVAIVAAADLETFLGVFLAVFGGVFVVFCQFLRETSFFACCFVYVSFNMCLPNANTY